MKKIISLILLLIWMFIIFNFSAMDGSLSHSKSTKLVRSIVQNKTILPTSEVKENSINSDVLTENSASSEAKVEKSENSKVNKENEVKINQMVSKYDGPVRKTAHVLEYFVLIILMMNFIFQVSKSRKIRYYLFGIVFCMLYACLDEFHQSYVSGRTGKVNDVLIDSIGIVVGAVLVIIVQKIWSFRKKRIE